MIAFTKQEAMTPSDANTAPPDSLAISTLRAAYTAGTLTPSALVDRLLARRPALPGAEWIHLLPAEVLQARARELEALGPAPSRPLYGIPFAVKDNIDVIDLPTTAACPAFAYVASTTAIAVQRLLEAGAILVGKTNLDQFATGLVGVRSPYGIPTSVFSREHVSGGSSSGSAVVVASGQVSFALGTDTAGSGRVPAMFNSLIGLKPTRGLLPNTGVVPACRSLDCLSVFALNASDAWQVTQLAAGPDAGDAWSRPASPRGLPLRPRIGVPKPAQREFFGDALAAAEYERALSRLAEYGELVEFDFAPFSEAAALLYDGPWVAERLEVTAALIANTPQALDATVRGVIEQGLRYSAADTHVARTRLAALQKIAEANWDKLDVIALPTAPTHYRVDEVLANPVRLNSHLGTYTNFANLLDLAAIAVPTSMRPDGLPFGISLFGPAWTDAALASLADHIHRASGLPCGLDQPPPSGPALQAEWPAQPGAIRLAVVGAHLSGMPLNRELLERAGRFVRACHTAPRYRLYALPGTVPPKPGLQQVSSGGAALGVEVWELSPAAFGDFVSRIPAPLGIGTLTLDDGEQVKGFLCEAFALADAQDITHFGGWRAYMASRSAA